jgi:uncharacterized protein (TIGR03437 family)
VIPGNRAAGWLTVSPLSGKGPAQLTLTARGAGYGDGAYRALLQFQSAGASPQTLTVPVMLVMGSNTSGIAISGVGNAATYKGSAAPGAVIAVFGTGLAGATNLATGSPINFSNSGVTAFINSVPAPVIYVSPNQLNVQVPYAAGAGPAVLSINNNGQVAGYLFQIDPAAPGVFTDASGNAITSAPVKAGSTATVYITGAGEITPALKTAYYPSSASSALGYKPLLPLSVTAGGAPAFVQSVSHALNQIGVLQVSFVVPQDTPPGPLPVVVRLGHAESPVVNVPVQ